MHAIYTMTFSDGSEYVGATSNMRSRITDHRKEMRRGTHSRQVQSMFDLYGYPVFTVVACGFSASDLHLLETAVITSRGPALNAITTPRPLPSRTPSTPSQVMVDGVLDFKRSHRTRLGISRNRYRRALRRGQNPFELGPPMAPPQRTITAAGRAQSIRAWSRESGVAHNTIAHRIDYLGWTPEQAVGLEPGPTKAKTAGRTPPTLYGRGAPIEYKGHIGTFSQLARQFGVPYARAYARFRAGRPLDQVFSV